MNNAVQNKNAVKFLELFISLPNRILSTQTCVATFLTSHLWTSYCPGPNFFTNIYIFMYSLCSTIWTKHLFCRTSSEHYEYLTQQCLLLHSSIPESCLIILVLSLVIEPIPSGVSFFSDHLHYC